MTFDSNDPRLTAYALGELDDAERSALETQLSGCPESRKYVEDVRDMARLLTDSFQNEQAATPGLTADQRQAIEATLTLSSEPVPAPVVVGQATPAAKRTRWVPLGFLALAASLLVGSVTLLNQMKDRKNEAMVLALDSEPLSTSAPSPTISSARRTT